MKLSQYECPACDTVATMEGYELVHRSLQTRGFYISCTSCDTEQNVLDLIDVTDDVGYHYTGDVEAKEAGLADRLTK